MSEEKSNHSLFKFAFIAAFVSSLCCISPIFFVLLGLASASAAAYWGNYLFFGYWDRFLAIGFLLMAWGLLIYWRRRGICTFDAAKRQRRKIINSILLAIPLFLGLYVLLEIVSELIWIWMGLTTWEEFMMLLGLVD